MLRPYRLFKTIYPITARIAMTVHLFILIAVAFASAFFDSDGMVITLAIILDIIPFFSIDSLLFQNRFNRQLPGPGLLRTSELSPILIKKGIRLSFVIKLSRLVVIAAFGLAGRLIAGLPLEGSAMILFFLGMTGFTLAIETFLTKTLLTVKMTTARSVILVYLPSLLLIDVYISLSSKLCAILEPSKVIPMAVFAACAFGAALLLEGSTKRRILKNYSSHTEVDISNED